MGSAQISVAAPASISVLETLINRAYRGDSSRLGWTTEADILAGRRCDTAMLRAIFSSPDEVILIRIEGSQLLGCVHLKKEGESAHFGMFAVEPARQNEGIGSALLEAAEHYANRVMGSHTMRMGIIGCRNDIIAYYKRRGYYDSLERVTFPQDLLWEPKVEGLVLHIYQKRLG